MTEKVKFYQFSQIQQSQSKMNIQKLFDKYGYQNRLGTEGKKKNPKSLVFEKGFMKKSLGFITS